jgi:hypothetical protein
VGCCSNEQRVFLYTGLNNTYLTSKENKSDAEQELRHLVGNVWPYTLLVSNFEVLEDVECKNYKVANNTACSVVFTGSLLNMPSNHAIIEVLSSTNSLAIEL